MLTNRLVRILLAEDSDDDYFFISEALGRSTLNYKLDWVKNGSEAINWLDEHFNKGEVPDLFLLDINMPKLNGHEVLERLRADFRFKHLLTIVLTSSKSPIDIQIAYENGANSFIVKNSQFDQLVSAMNSLNSFYSPFNLLHRL